MQKHSKTENALRNAVIGITNNVVVNSFFCIFAKKEMPTIFIFFGFRFMFYSNDHTPIHVHVIKDGNEAKYNVQPIEQIYNHGFKKHDIALIESLISENEDIIIDRWKEYFGK